MGSAKEEAAEAEAEDEEEGALPPGFRFHPTDEELLCYYLRRRVDGRPQKMKIISDIDLYRFEPWELPGRQPGSDEKFYFTPRDRKYPSGLRSNRATPRGYWKATGKDRPVYGEAAAAERLMGRQRGGGSQGTPGDGGPGTESAPGQAVCIGYKKTLVFYLGRAPAGEKSDWIMHEYRLSEESDAPTTSAGAPPPAYPAGTQGPLLKGGASLGGGGPFFPHDTSTQSNQSQGDSLAEGAPEGDPGSAAGGKRGEGTALRTPLSSWVVIRVYQKRLLPQGSDSENYGAMLGGPGSLSGKGDYGFAAGPVVKVRAGGVVGSSSFTRRAQGQPQGIPLSRSGKGESASPAVAPAASAKAASGWVQVPGVDPEQALGATQSLSQQHPQGGGLGGQHPKQAEELQPGMKDSALPTPNASTGLGTVGTTVLPLGNESARPLEEAARVVAKGAPDRLLQSSALQRSGVAMLDEGPATAAAGNADQGNLASLTDPGGGQAQAQHPPQLQKEEGAGWASLGSLEGLASVALTEQQKQLLLLTEEGQQLLLLQEQQLQTSLNAKPSALIPPAPLAHSSTAAAAAAAAAASAAARAILFRDQQQQHHHQQQQQLYGAAGMWQPSGAGARGPPAASPLAPRAADLARHAPPLQQPKDGAAPSVAPPVSILQKLGVNLNTIRNARPQANQAPPKPGVPRATQAPQDTSQAPAWPTSTPAPGEAVPRPGAAQAGAPPRPGAPISQRPAGNGAGVPTTNPPARGGLERRFSELLETAFQSFMQRAPQAPLQDPSSGPGRAQDRPPVPPCAAADARAVPAGPGLESQGQSVPSMRQEEGNSEAQQPSGLPNALSTPASAPGEEGAKQSAAPAGTGNPDAGLGEGTAAGPGAQTKGGAPGDGFGSSPLAFSYSLQWLEEMLSDAGAVWGPPGGELAGGPLQGQGASRRSPVPPFGAWSVNPGPGTGRESGGAQAHGEARASPAPGEAQQLQGQAGAVAGASAEGAHDATFPQAATANPGVGEPGAGGGEQAPPSASGSTSQRVEFVRAVSDLLLRELLELQAGEEGQLVVGTAAAAAAAAAAATTFNPGLLLPGMHEQGPEQTAEEAAGESGSEGDGTSQTRGQGHKRQHSSCGAPEDTRAGQARLQAEAALASKLGFMTASPSAWAMGQTPTLHGAPWAWNPQGPDNPAHQGHPPGAWEGQGEDAGGTADTETHTEPTEADQGWAASKRSRREGGTRGSGAGAAPGVLQDEPEVSSPAPLHVPWQSDKPGGL